MWYWLDRQPEGVGTILLLFNFEVKRNICTGLRLSVDV
jgi:hypothetical protein